MAASLKEMQALERALRRREELAKPRQELVGTCKEFVGRVFQATKDACAAFIEDYLHMMDEAANAHLADYSHPETARAPDERIPARLAEGHAPEGVGCRSAHLAGDDGDLYASSRCRRRRKRWQEEEFQFRSILRPDFRPSDEDLRYALRWAFGSGGDARDVP